MGHWLVDYVIRVLLALIKRKKRKEEGIEEGVFIDRRRAISIGD